MEISKITQMILRNDLNVLFITNIKDIENIEKLFTEEIINKFPYFCKNYGKFEIRYILLFIMYINNNNYYKRYEGYFNVCMYNHYIRFRDSNARLEIIEIILLNVDPHRVFDFFRDYNTDIDYFNKLLDLVIEYGFDVNSTYNKIPYLMYFIYTDYGLDNRYDLMYLFIKKGAMLDNKSYSKQNNKYIKKEHLVLLSYFDDFNDFIINNKKWLLKTYDIDTIQYINSLNE